MVPGIQQVLAHQLYETFGEYEVQHRVALGSVVSSCHLPLFLVALRYLVDHALAVPSRNWLRGRQHEEGCPLLSFPCWPCS